MENIKNLDIHIDEHYAEILRGKELTVPRERSWELIKTRNRGRESYIAFSEGDRKITYGQMFENWDETARVLTSLGISGTNNSRALIIMPNVAKTGAFDYGSDITGAVASFIDPTSTFDKIEKYIESERITDIISSDLLYLKNMGKKLTERRKELGIRNVILYRDKYLNSLMPRKYKLVSSILDKIVKKSPNIVRYDDAIRNSLYTRIDYSKKGVDELSLLTHTSGTITGIGKPIPISDFNRNALNKNYELAQFQYEPGMTMMHFIPYFAGYGAVNTAHLGLTQGLELQQIPLFNPNDFGGYLQKYKSNIILANPACWLSLVNNPKYNNIDLSFLVYASTGGAPMTIDEEEKINKFLIEHNSKVLLTKGYGLSELCGCCIVTIDGYNRVGSVGVRHPLMDIKLFDSKKQRFLGDRECGTGEVYVNSETLTMGTLDGTLVVNKETINAKDYLKTGDILKRDCYGQYYYIERKDRMFNRYDGYNIYPLNVEKIFIDYDEINNAVIVPEFDEDNSGNVPKVYIELGSSYDIDKEKIIRTIIENSFLSNKKGHIEYISNYREIPRTFIFVNEIPKNTMGKNNYSLITKEGIMGEKYTVEIAEDNMGVLGYEVIQGAVKQKTIH